MQESKASMRSFLRGYARVPITNLKFDTGRVEDGKITQRLAEIFRSPRGCQNDDSANTITVVLDSDVDVALSKSTADAPLLDARQAEALTCLHGRHRVLAGRKTLPAHDRWWIARVYDHRLPRHLRKDIQQRNQESRTFSDGEILHHLLDARANDQSARMAELMAMMDKWRREQFLHLERYDNGELMTRIARLMDFEGMRAGFGFGRLAPVLSMHCHEEIYAYLDNVHRRWTRILGSHLSPAEIDGETVRCLELMAPKHSLHDFETICDLVDEGRVFPQLTDAKERQAIKERLRDCDRVLTIHSFFEDMIYARACFEALRTLLPPLPRHKPDFRLRDGFRHAFVERSSAFWPSYVSIWLYVLRNFPGLPAGKNGAVRVCNRKKRKGIAPAAMHVDMAFVAKSLGFDTDEIGAMIANSTASSRPEILPSGPPRLSSHRQNVCEHARSNRPCHTTYPSIANDLYPSHVFETIEEPPGTFVTPFALVRDMVLCFWGGEYERERGIASSLWGAGEQETFPMRRADSPDVGMTTIIECLRSRSPSPHDSMSDDDEIMEDDSVNAAAPGRRDSTAVSEGQGVSSMVAISEINSQGLAAHHRSHRAPSAGSSAYSRAVDGAEKQLAILDARQPQRDPRVRGSPGCSQEGFNQRSPAPADRATRGKTREIFPSQFSLASTATDPPPGRLLSVESPRQHRPHSARLSNGKRNVSAKSAGAPNSSGVQTENVAAFPRAWDDPVDPKNQGSPSRLGKRTFDAAGLPSHEAASQSTKRSTNFPSQLVDGGSPQPSHPVQKQTWDAEQSVVQSILGLKHKPSSNKIYVASVCDIRGPLQRDPRDQKLRGWREDQRAEFMGLMQQLPKQQALKIVKVSEDYSNLEYQTVNASDCWERLWRSRRMYPFAVVVQNTEERSNKIMRANAVGDSSVGRSWKSVRQRIG